MEQEYTKASLEEATAKSRLHEALTRCARLECLQLTELMCRKLPAELRNVVYTFLCLEDQTIPVGPYYHFREYKRTPETELEIGHDGGTLNTEYIVLPDGRIKYDHSEKPAPGILMPHSHIFSPQYVGAAVASETEKTYYANNTFSVCNVDRGIPRFLEYGSYRDVDGHFMPGMDMTVNPYDLVRTLQIRLKYEHFDSLLRDFLPGEIPGNRETFMYECNFLRSLRNDLGLLQHLPQQTRPLNLEFIIMTTFVNLTDAAVDAGGADEHRRFINLLQAIRNTMYALMYDRENTTVNIVHHDEHLYAFPRKLTALWSLSKVQWAHVRTGFSSFFLCPTEAF